MVFSIVCVFIAAILAAVLIWSVNNRKVPPLIVGLLGALFFSFLIKGLTSIPDSGGIDRCHELTQQKKDVRLVGEVCWIGLGNGLYFQDGTKYTEARTREELLQSK